MKAVSNHCVEIYSIKLTKIEVMRNNFVSLFYAINHHDTI